MSCKICNSECTTIYNFGKQYLANDFRYKASVHESPQEILELVRCNKCNTIQLSHFIDPSVLYNYDYKYKTYCNDPLIRHFKQLANYIENHYYPTEVNNILDIGSNDGTFISLFKDKYCAIGVDPSAIYDNDLQQYCRFFNKEFAKEFLSERKKPSVITALNVLAHVPNVHEFLDAIKMLMNKKTILIIEVQHNKQICQGIFDQIYHEHCYYFDCHTLTSLLNSHGIKVNTYQIFTELNGGTLRVECTLGKQTKPIPLDPYSSVSAEHLHNSIQYSIKAISEMIDHLFLTTGDIDLIGYGAPAKAALMVNQIPELQSISYVLDTTIEKDGLCIPGTKIPIRFIDDWHHDYKENLIPKDPCAIFMFSWNYFYHIMRKNNNFHNHYVMVPFPNQNIYWCQSTNLRKIV